MFPNLSQKVKSGLLREIWNLDPFKAKWSILAKAYSKVRDNHSDQVSLDSFLSLNGPLIGIVPPHEYVASMGLQLSKKSEKEYEVSKQSEMGSPSQSELTTNLSVDDIVSYCYQSGYVSGKAPQNDDETLGVGVAMAVTAQTTKQSRSDPRSESDHVSRGSTWSHDVMEMRDTLSPKVQSRDAIASSPSVQYSMISDFKTSGTENGNKIQHIMQSEVPYTAAEIDSELRNAIDNFQVDGDPYLALFNPSIQAPVVLYNPYEVQ
ncbi:SAGA HAT/Core module component, partial [Ascosphaera pollenicola]